MGENVLTLNVVLGVLALVVAGFWAFLARATRFAGDEVAAWRTALAERRKARHRLRWAWRELKKARRVHGKLHEPPAELRNASKAGQTAQKNADVAAKELREAGAQVAESIRGSIDLDRENLDASIVQRLWGALATVERRRDDARAAMSGTPEFLGKHWSIVSGIALTIVVAGDLVYYELFDFNVLPYYWDYPVGTLFITVALGVPVLLIFLGLFVTIDVMLLLWRAGLLTIVLALSVLRRASYGVAKLYCVPCKSRAYARLTLGLMPAGGLTLRSAFSGLARYWRHVRTAAVRLQEVTTSGRRVVWTQVVLAVVGVAVFVVLFEPAYRAHAACQRDGGARVVLDPPMAGGQDDFVRIGSLGQHVFLVTEGSCRGTTESAAVDGGRREWADWLWEGAEPIRVAVAWLREREDATASRGRDGCGIPVIRRACAALDERMDYFGAERLPGLYAGEVVVVPPNRVLCMYEEPFGEPRICAPPEVEEVAPDGGGESLLVAQLQGEVPCGEQAEVSEAIVFGRDDATVPIRNGYAEMARFLLTVGADWQLFAFGFASPDGRRTHNEELALRRAERVAEIVMQRYDGTIQDARSFGEDHFSNGILASRSVRLVACAPREDE